MTSARKIKQVAVLIDDVDAYAREVLVGIGRYQRESDPHWALHIVRRNRFQLPPPFLQSWEGHGIIARVDSLPVESELGKLDIPVVSVSGALKVPRFPTLIQDSHLAARLAVDHFRERGHRNFCFVGYHSLEWSVQRGRSFQEHLSHHGIRLKKLLLHDEVAFGFGGEGIIADWLLSMKGPLAVWAANDEIGLKVLNACLAAGISVPEDFAVLGVDNDPSISRLAPRHLSSIKLNGRGAGYEAAKLLASWMSGEVPGPGCWKSMAPLGIESRASTEVHHINDPQVERALSIIHEDACKGVSVEEVASRISLSRSQLERRFRASLNKTPFEEIRRIQVCHAGNLLETTDLSIKEVAARSGYVSVKSFIKLFKSQMIDTPNGFRLSRREALARERRLHQGFCIPDQKQVQAPIRHHASAPSI